MHLARNPATLALWSVLSLGIAAQDGQAKEAPKEASPEPKVLGVDVTFLANEGFFLESGRYSVLIDAFLREPTDIYAGLPSETYKQLVQAKPPFDLLTIVLVSHNHPDHVQLRGLEKYLGNNNQAQLMTSPQILGALRAEAKDFEAIKQRVTPIRTVPGSVEKLLQEEMSIEVFELKHGGKLNAEVLNLAHLIEMGGVKLLHVGDAEPAVENFSRYNLDQRQIDVAFVPYWFFGSPAGVQVLQEEIKARTVVACHVPPSEWDKLNQLMKAQFPNVVLFKEAMEKRSFSPAERGGAEPKKDGG